jgi:hypothetical protein
MKNLQKGLTNVWLVIIIVVAVLVVGYFAFVKKPSGTNQNTISTPQTSVIECPAGQVYSGSKCIVPEPGTTNPNMSGGKGVATAYKTYQLQSSSGSINLQYQNNLNVTGTTGKDNSGYEVEIKNFDWQRDAFSFGYIRPLLSNQFLLQMRALNNPQNLSLADWMKASINSTYNSPERLQIIGEYKDLYGTVSEQQQATVDGKTALQRTVAYGNLNITYTYVNEGSQVFQFINVNNTAGNLEIYNKILSTFVFTKN